VIKLRADNLFWRETQAEIFALDATSSRYYSANSTAATLWPQIEAGTTETELVDTLCGRYDVERDVATDAVAAFLAQLHERGLLEHDG
jgi:hypothetical protein